MKGTKPRLVAPVLAKTDIKGMRQLRKHMQRAKAGKLPVTGTRHYNRWAWLYRPNPGAS